MLFFITSLVLSLYPTSQLASSTPVLCQSTSISPYAIFPAQSTDLFFFSLLLSVQPLLRPISLSLSISLSFHFHVHFHFHFHFIPSNFILNLSFIPTASLGSSTLHLSSLLNSAILITELVSQTLYPLLLNLHLFGLCYGV